MEDWDNYCSISKNARQILNKLDQPSAQSGPLPTSTNPLPCPSSSASYLESFKSSLQLHTDQLHSSYKQSLQINDLIQQLNQSKQGIMSASRDINEKCQKIIQERSALVSINSSIQSKYFYYTHLEALSSQVLMFSRDSVSIRKQFLETLSQIEDALQFFNENPHYREASYYLYEYETLLDNWVHSFKSSLSESFQLFYTYYDNFFKTILNTEDLAFIFKQLIITPARYDDSYYFIDEIIQQFYKIRAKHISKVTNEALAKIRSEKLVVRQSEMACEVLNLFWKKEKKIFLFYFSAECPQDQLNIFFQNYSEPVYESLRENLLQEDNVERLCQTSSLLQQYSKSGLAHVFSSLSQDVQERIIYAVTFYLSEEIIPSYSSEPVHPAVKKTLKLLNLVSSAVNPDIFDNITNEAISVCINVLKKSVKSDDYNEVHVFLIRNLLDLRQKLDEIGVVLKGNCYKELDFSDTKRLFWKLVMGEVSLKSKGVFAELVSSGVPKFNEKSENPLESELGAACSSYILRTFHEICNPILLVILRSKESGSVPYELAEKTLVECTNRIQSVFPAFSQALFVTLDEKNYKEMTENVSLQVLKAFAQLLNLMKELYPSRPVAGIEDIERILDSSA